MSQTFVLLRGNETDILATDSLVVKRAGELFYSKDTKRTFIYDGSAAREIGAQLTTRDTDPADPPAGESHIWVSDGTGSGDDGDLMIKITDSLGTTKTATLVDFSSV